MNAAVLAAVLVLSPSATPQERALFDEAVRLTLNSETGRSLAERAAAGGFKTEVRFEDLDGIGGRAEPSASGDRVVLARSLLGWKPEWAGIEAARTLAHEAFGHILAHQRARAAGVSWELGCTLDDEVNAGVVGYLVELESGWRFLDPNAELLLKDRAAYEASLLTQQPAYAATLRGTELDAPVAALRGRLAELPPGRPALTAFIPERLAYLEGDPARSALLTAYKSHPFRAALRAEIDARVERLRALAPPLPGEQSPGT